MFGKVFRKFVLVLLILFVLSVSVKVSAYDGKMEETKTDIGVALVIVPASDECIIYHILPYESIVMSDEYYEIRKSLEKNKNLLSVNTFVFREKGKQNCIEHYLVATNSEVDVPVYERMQVIINDSLDLVEEGIQNYTAEGYTFVDQREEGKETILIFEKN